MTNSKLLNHLLEYIYMIDNDTRNKIFCQISSENKKVFVYTNYIGFVDNICFSNLSNIGFRYMQLKFKPAIDILKYNSLEDFVEFYISRYFNDNKASILEYLYYCIDAYVRINSIIYYGLFDIDDNEYIAEYGRMLKNIDLNDSFYSQYNSLNQLYNYIIKGDFRKHNISFPEYKYKIKSLESIANNKVISDILDMVTDNDKIQVLTSTNDLINISKLGYTICNILYKDDIIPLCSKNGIYYVILKNNHSQILLCSNIKHKMIIIEREKDIKYDVIINEEE